VTAITIGLFDSFYNKKSNKIELSIFYTNRKHTRNCIGISSISISAIVIVDGGFVLFIGDSSAAVGISFIFSVLAAVISFNVSCNSLEEDNFGTR